MARWQRWIRLALGVFAIVFATGVYFAIQERRPPRPAATTPRTDPTAVAESTRGETLIARGTTEDFTVKYARALSYADGSLKFEQVRVTVPRRSGRDFVITAQQAEVRNNQSSVALHGDVMLTASDGLVAKAAEATYDNGEGIVRVPGPAPLSFSRGRVSGTSVGGTYDRGRDVLTLLDQAHITIAPDAQGSGSADISGGSAVYARRERYIQFERGVRVVRAGQVVESDGALAHLVADDDRIEAVELRGNSRVVRDQPQPGGLESMAARDMNLAYAADGQTLQHAVLSGTSVVQMAGDPGQPGRRLASDLMDLQFGPDGASVVALTAREGVQLDLPPDQSGIGRRVRSTLLEASGPPEKGIEKARFTENVEFVESRAATGNAPALERVARARTLDAAVGSGFSAIRTAEFGGGVTFRDGALDAAAPSATYAVADGTLKLVAGPPGGAGARVNDARATIQARTIDITLEGKGMVADADVRTLLKPTGAEGTSGSAAGQRAVKRPGLLQSDKAANVTGAHLVYDSDTGQATYTGGARLWQGETTIQGNTITIDDTAGNLKATGTVRSTLRMEHTDDKTGKSSPETTIVTANELLYEDAVRRATYMTNARLVGPEGDLRADRIELYLLESGDELDRLEAYGKVSLRSGNRSSTGLRLTYFAADGRYVMSGTPVRALDQRPTECLETIGKTLTFFRSTDTISVDGNEESRTQTTSGGKCPEPRT